MCSVLSKLDIGEQGICSFPVLQDAELWEHMPACCILPREELVAQGCWLFYHPLLVLQVIWGFPILTPFQSTHHTLLHLLGSHSNLHSVPLLLLTLPITLTKIPKKSNQRKEKSLLGLTAWVHHVRDMAGEKLGAAASMVGRQRKMKAGARLFFLILVQSRIPFCWVEPSTYNICLLMQFNPTQKRTDKYV